MVIENHTVASVAYKIYLNGPDGELVESVEEQSPKEILMGKDHLISGFENGLLGKGIGEFLLDIDPEGAFGPVFSELKVPVSKNAFMDQGTLREDLLYVNNTINMLDQNGRQLRGTILEIGDEDVIMDFNHPYAGRNLFIAGNILSIRTATEFDLDSRGGCGCGSGGCGCGNNHSNEHSSCCSSDNHGEEGCEACGTPSEKSQQDVMSH